MGGQPAIGRVPPLLAVLLVGACAGTPAPTAAPATTNTPTTVTTPTTVVTTSPTTPSPGRPRVPVEPGGALVGVALGTAAETAANTLEAALGPPGSDSGWVVGCPLDGDEANERTLQWGSLTVHLLREPGTSGEFFAWTYRVDGDDGDVGPRPDELELPDGIRPGAPMAAAAASLGVPLVVDDVFGSVTASVDGLVLWGFGDDGTAPLVLIGVPVVPVCD